jgi:ABC-type transport system substrate-binding protein
VLDLPDTIAPSAPSGAPERLVQGLLHATLVGIDAEGQPTPGLARSWTSAAGEREWTLTLEGGLHFHNGSALAAADAVRSLRRFLRSPSPAAARLAESLDGGADFRAWRSEDLAGLTAPAGDLVVLRFVEPQALPLAPLSASAAAITAANDAACGPFTPTLVVPGKRLALNAFSGHARGRPYLDAIDVLRFADRGALKAALQAGTVDVALGESGTAASKATLLLVLDPSRTPFDALGLRIATAAAVDRAELVRHWLPGGEAGVGLLAPRLLPSANLVGRVAQAATSAHITLTVARDVPAAASQRVVACLGETGLVVRVLPDTPERARRASSEARLLLFSPEVAEAGLALDELSALVPTAPALTQSLSAARRERDPERRRLLLLRAEERLRAESTLVPLATAPVAAATRSNVHGVKIDLAGTLHLDDAWREP